MKSSLAESQIKEKLKRKTEAVKSFFRDKKEPQSSNFSQKVKLGFSKMFRRTKQATQQRQEILYDAQD